MTGVAMLKLRADGIDRCAYTESRRWEKRGLTASRVCVLAKGYASNKKQPSKYPVVRRLADFVKGYIHSKRPLNRHPVGRRKYMIMPELVQDAVTAVRRHRAVELSFEFFWVCC